jgi:hypothetical protein
LTHLAKSVFVAKRAVPLRIPLKPFLLDLHQMRGQLFGGAMVFEQVKNARKEVVISSDPI